MAALPVLTLFFVLLVLKKNVWLSALCGFIVAAALAAWILGMPPLLVSNAAMHGFVFGFLQIAWIIIASIFLYNISLETGQFEVMKQSIAALSQDVRIQMVLIAFCFGAFLEGTVGGGTPVAIAGWILLVMAVAYASYQTREQLGERQIPLMGVLAAFTFAAQMINFPVAHGPPPLAA